MQRFLIVFFLFIALARSRGQSKQYLVEDWGMVKFGDTILVDYTEITCGEYLDFLYYQNPGAFKNYLLNRLLDETEMQLLKKIVLKPELLPDDQILATLPYYWLFRKCENCSTFVFESVSSIATVPVPKDSMLKKTQINNIRDLLNLPIVGISFEQATAFCDWRTKRNKLENRFRHQQKALIEYDTTTLKFSLPSPAEFDLVNLSNDSISNRKGITSTFNHKNARYRLNSDPQNARCGKTLMRVQSFQKFRINSLVDIQGNVAEMTSSKGQSKGGSYFHYAAEGLKGTTLAYEKQERWLGFRCVAKLDKNVH